MTALKVESILSTDGLLKMRDHLRKKRASYTGKRPYHVPGLWLPAGTRMQTDDKVPTVNPYDFYADHIDAILEFGKKNPPLHFKPGTKGDWIRQSVLYSFTPRVSSAFDHNQDGDIGGSGGDITLSEDGYRETGTFLKSIALLGHIDRLGCSALYMLPITSIGRDGNKGELGSPYAIRNPCKIDPFLADPMIDAPVDLQFEAFVEACHLLGIYVILEFVFRTAAKDADWIKEHPEWFYWIDAAIPERERGETDPQKLETAYGNPYFNEKELQRIKRQVRLGRRRDFPAPHEAYRKMFLLPPEGPAKVRKLKSGHVIGLARDPITKKEVKARIPGAFADWPPDDIQPPWGDVTYLRMYVESGERPRFNYIAYNTIRMYDEALARPENENRPLWDRIVGIIPHYIRSFGIDGVLIDMGHAMPPPLMREIIETARDLDPDFTFLSENFSIDEKSRAQGFNAVMGYSWSASHKREGILQLLTHAGVEGMPLPFMATAENHNTPRAAARQGGVLYSMASHLLHSFIPWGIPFIHSGFELGETHPFNTGLDFTPEDLERYKDMKLPLFDVHGFDWMKGGDLIPYLEKIAKIRSEYRDIILDTSRESFLLLDTGNPRIVGFRRRGKSGGRQVTLIALLNINYDSAEEFSVSRDDLEDDAGEEFSDLINLEKFSLEEGRLHGLLRPGQGVLLRVPGA